MAKFKFALEGLKKFRAHRLLLAKKEMIAIEDQIRSADNERAHAQNMRADLLNERNQKMSQGESALGCIDLIESQTLKMASVSGRMLRLEAELARHKEWVALLGRELKAVEKLEERKQEQFYRELGLKEKRISDSWVTDRWAYDMSQREDS